MKRALVPSAALLWGLQFAFLNPALAPAEHAKSPETTETADGGPMPRTGER